MTCYYHHGHHESNATESLICRHLRAARRQRNEFRTGGQRTRRSALHPVGIIVTMMMMIFMTFVLIPVSLGFRLAPSYNSVRRIDHRDLWTLPQCLLCLPSPLPAEENEENDLDDTLSFAPDNESITNAAKNIPDDDDNEDRTGRITNIETPAVTTIGTTTTTDPNFMTDRFKYKVNALMGAFDPMDASTDTETTSGNILNALMKFPVTYTFHVVGKTNGDAATQSSFVQQVQQTIQASCDSDDEQVRYDVTQRGTKYTKVSIQKQVMNAQEITFIYDQLSQLDGSVMQF